MENQELNPKKPEIQNENPEMERQEQQNLKEKLSTDLSDIDKRIENKAQINEDTKKQVDDVRSQLGLSSSTEIIQSINIEQDAIKNLIQKKSIIEKQIDEIINRSTLKVEGIPTITNREDIQKYKELKKQLEFAEQKGGQESNEDTKRFEGNLKNIIEDISGKSKTMIDALYERQQQQFTPLQNYDEFQGIMSNFKSLKNFEGKYDVDGLDTINQNIQKIARLVENMNPKSSGGVVRESPQNLEKLAYGAKIFSASLDEAGRNFGLELTDEKKEEKMKELRNSLGLLSEQVQKLNSLAARMRSNFR